jgi:hypothetical protein
MSPGSIFLGGGYKKCLHQYYMNTVDFYFESQMAKCNNKYIIVEENMDIVWIFQ